jgi:hypothetical protein
MKKINLFVLIIAILMTFMYLNSRERIAALGDSVKDYLTQVEELQEQLAKNNAPIPPSNLPEAKFEENTYPVYAELVDSDEEHGEYRFRVLNVTQDEGFDGIYTLETNMAVYEDAPYILTMDNNGTKETSDDYIAVVWIATP